MQPRIGWKHPITRIISRKNKESSMNRKCHFHALMVLFVAALSPFALAQKAPEIPSGTTIKIRMIDRLTSAEARVGDTFRASLEDPIMVNDKELYPRGADITGRVVDV